MYLGGRSEFVLLLVRDVTIFSGGDLMRPQFQLEKSSQV